MITAEHLTKRYRQHVAVDNVSFTCEPGTVTGFLGPNGAGKSTTLRMLTGLTRPTSGRVTIDGRRTPQLPNPGRLIGVMLDAAAQHPGRTGLETLRITAQLLDLPTEPGRRECSSGSASATPASAGSATTRSACVSGSASPAP